MNRCAAWLAAVACASAAAGQQEFCLSDADGDGHPMFGNPAVRTGFEVYNGLTSYATARAVAAALGDMDGDGDPDAVVINVKPYNPTLFFLTVLRNHGDGVFDPADTPYPVGWEGTDVALGDLDGDMDVDAAVPNARDNTVSMLFNNGDATFAPHVTRPVGQMPRCVRIADLDHDRDLDLVVLNTVSNDVSILLNNGDGTFAPEVRVFVGNVTPRGDPNLNFAYLGPFLALGDLNGDGHPDIAVPCKSQVKLLLNNGSGAFALAPSHASVAIPNAYCVVIADLDGDFKPDLAASCLYSAGGPNCLSVMRNLGGGVFAPPTAYNAGWSNSPGAVQWATTLTAGDVDGDGDLDLAVGHEVTGAPVILMRNRGNGTFDPKEEIMANQGPWHVRFADLNGDGRLDLGVVSRGQNGRSLLTALLNNGAGSVTTYARYPSVLEPCCQNWNWLEGADLDDDGDTDLVATMNNPEYAYHVRVLLNDGRGAFDTIHSYALGPVGTAAGNSVAIGNLNGDNVPDLVVCDTIVPGGFTQPGRVWTLMGRGDGTFNPPTPYPMTGQFPLQAAIADLDGDGDRDVAVWTTATYPGNELTPVVRSVVVFANEGKGSLRFHRQVTTGVLPWGAFGGITTFRFDADAAPDIAVTISQRFVPGWLVVLRNLGSLQFQPDGSVSLPAFPRVILPLASDSNSHDNLVVALAASEYNNYAALAIIRNDNGAICGSAQVFRDPLASATSHISRYSSTKSTWFSLPQDHSLGSVSRLNRGEWDFRHSSLGYWPTAVVLGDFDRDGRVDLAASLMADRGVAVLLNRSCRSCSADCDGNGALTLADFACFQARFMRGDPSADCNHDAQLTVADFGCFQTKFVAGCR